MAVLFILWSRWIMQCVYIWSGIYGLNQEPRFMYNIFLLSIDIFLLAMVAILFLTFHLPSIDMYVSYFLVGGKIRVQHVSNCYFETSLPTLYVKTSKCALSFISGPCIDFHAMPLTCYIKGYMITAVWTHLWIILNSKLMNFPYYMVCLVCVLQASYTYVLFQIFIYLVPSIMFTFKAYVFVCLGTIRRFSRNVSNISHWKFHGGLRMDTSADILELVLFSLFYRQHGIKFDWFINFLITKIRSEISVTDTFHLLQNGT
jgi:hypothetical protein